MSVHRFHLPAAGPGLATLPEAARNHATRVLRLSEGDTLRVFDAGREFNATIVSMSKTGVKVEVGEAFAPLPERTARIHLVMSPLKGDLTELVIQKATELGVSRISPVVFERTDTVARRDPGEARLERWRRVAISAAEQCGRAVVPGVDPFATLKGFVAGLRPPANDELRVMAAEPSLGLGNPPRPARVNISSILVAVGPSGGLSAEDIALLGAAGFRAERIATHTLRSETACIAALAILGARYDA